MSVPSPSDVQATFADTLVDEWIGLGITDAVVCPGSRSTPLALAIAARSELALHVRLDERGAGFFAIGRALVTQRPVIVLVTSGTAAAELHAAVAEADQAFVPLIVVTADRPPELHGIGAPQTMPQNNLFGPMVRLCEDPGVANNDERGTWRPLARRIVDAAMGREGRVGPVQLNAAFIEPLVGVSLEMPPSVAPGAVRDRQKMVVVPVGGKKVLAVVGAGLPSGTIEQALALGWVVVGDATSKGTTSFADGLLRHDGFAQAVRPDVVVRIGGIPASKIVAQRLREWGAPIVGVDLGHPVSDPDQIIGEVLVGTALSDDESARGDASYATLWQRAVARAQENFRGLSFATGLLTEAAIARTVVQHCNETHRNLVVGSSMPVREVEWFAEPRTSPVFSNRGVNGIDGVVSTAFGVGADEGAVALVGDLTFLHDASALVDPPNSAMAVVVVANDGGHIFDFLPQSAQVDAERFRRLFTTPRTAQPAEVARGFGLRAVVVTTVGELNAALRDAATHLGVTVIEARPLAPVSNVEFHAWMNRSLGRVADEVLAS